MKTFQNILTYNISAGLLLTTLLFLSTHAQAYKLIPLSVEMSPTGLSARQSFRIENPSKVPIAVELKMFARSMSLDGTDVLTEAEDDFVIFPAQAIIMPGKTQVIRLQWIGDANPKQELAYRMITEQLPVSFDASQADSGMVKLLVRFIASVYIVPRNTHPDIQVTSIKNIRDSNGKNNILINLSNKGTAHTLLRKTTLTFTAGNSQIKLTADQLPMMASQNILAGHNRTFVIPKPDGLDSGEINALIKYQGQ